MMKNITGLLALVVGISLSLGALAQESKQRLPALRRIALISPSEPRPIDPLVQAILTKAREEEGKRKPLLDREAQRRERFAKLQGKKPPPPPQEPKYTPEQMRQLGAIVFAETLEQRLQLKLKTEILTEKRVQSTQSGLGLTDSQIRERNGAERLSADLDCDAILFLEPSQIQLRDRRERLVIFSVETRIPVYRTAQPNAAFEEEGFSFTTCGTTSVRRSFLSGDYVGTLPEATMEAARQAARRAVHTLQTREFYPLLERGAHLAIFPTPAPQGADRLLFTPRGRKLVQNNLTGLPADVSHLFAPSLLPLLSGSLVEASTVRKMLQKQGLALNDLWQNELPQITKIRALGRALKVDYVLMARIHDVEALGAQNEDSLPIALQNGESERVFEVRAEAIGVLVRVSTGAILWKENRVASLSVPPSRIETKGRFIERRIALDAIRFALVGLERSFARYGAGFEQ